ncbi:MAG: hypothetical protein IKK84_05045 [Clostridia bacterium]|nr:hypothetical protein [Clostridia bacterium]
MKNRNILKKVSMIFLCMSVLLSILPVTVSAANTSVPGAEGHVLTDIITGTFEGGYDSTILVYSTPNVSDSIKYEINDNMAIFEIPSYDSSNWYFDGWLTWYKGSQLGAGVVTSDKANPKYNDDLNYFERNADEKVVSGKYYAAGSMSVYKEDAWQGTYYLSAIFKPIVTVNVGDGVSYTVSQGTAINNNKYAVTYGGNASINYTITDSRYKVKSISASYGTNYSEQDGKVNVNSIERPVTITIQTELKPEATYIAPTEKTLTYNEKQQELVNKGTSTEGTLMYSLEENGTYSENVPTGKNAGEYTVWYYVKGDANHLDSAKQSITVSISKANADIGEVTAQVLNNITDISQVVLSRTNTTLKGILKIKDGQTLVYGNNEVEYVFTPEDNNYNTVEGKVNVVVADTIAPVGTVSINGTASANWNQIVEPITFELFFNTDQILQISVNDNLSGVDKIEYYRSEEIIDANLLEDEKWETVIDGKLNLKAENKKLVYYVRITDKANNVSLLSTNGLVFDTVAPKISGVEDGKTYNSTKTITISDENLDKVTLNGENATNKITLKKTNLGTYKIVATDKAGNVSTVTVEISNNPPTGDNIMLYIMLVLVSSIGLIITIRAKKAIKNN